MTKTTRECNCGKTDCDWLEVDPSHYGTEPSIPYEDEEKVESL